MNSGATAAVAQNRRTRSRPPSAASSRKSDDPSAASANGNGKGPSKPTSPNHVAGERTVKKLRLSKALTIPEGTTVSEACRRMAARRVDAVLLTDVNGLLSGIVTDKV
uniref:CBS domain-containing protein n=1 Tax=Aegilops tauschii subsp. strangulata TaxID=200361 RepID=A0A453HLU2_AEGTS